jgi:hypothetical protein
MKNTSSHWYMKNFVCNPKSKATKTKFDDSDYTRLLATQKKQLSQ